MSPISSHLGVIGALPEEIELLHDRLVDERVERIARRTYRTGTLLDVAGSPQVTLVQSRMGKVAAAVTATTLIREFGVDGIVFTGIAGALAPGVGIGDVVIATDLVQHDILGPPDEFRRGDVPLLGVRDFVADPALSDAAERAALDFFGEGFTELVPAEVLADLGIRRPRVHRGRVVTGDEFIHGDGKAVVLGREAAAVCVDMEGAAVAQVCFEHGGVPLCVIRAISDLASGEAVSDFPKFRDALARHYGWEIIRRMWR